MSLIIEPKAGDTMFDLVANRPASPSLLHSNVLSFSETAKLMSEGSVGTLSSCTRNADNASRDGVSCRRVAGSPQTSRTSSCMCSHCTRGNLCRRAVQRPVLRSEDDDVSSTSSAIPRPTLGISRSYPVSSAHKPRQRRNTDSWARRQCVASPRQCWHALRAASTIRRLSRGCCLATQGTLQTGRLPQLL